MVHSMIWLELDWTFEMSKCSSAIWIKLDGNFLLYTQTCKKKLLISDYQTKKELISNLFFVFHHYQNAHGKRKTTK